MLINVQVYSRGAHFEFPSQEPLTPVVCQVWACTGTNGVGPISALPSVGGAVGLEGLVLGVIDVPDFYGVASVLWTPSAADGLVFDANGSAHICLAANLVYRSSPGSIPASQGQPLPQFMSGGQPVRTIFPCGDGPIDPLSAAPIGHFQGQRNIQVLSTSSSLAIPLMLWAGDGESGPHVLSVSERVERALADAVIREHLLAHTMIDLRGGKARRQRTRRMTPRQLGLLGSGFDERLLGAGPLPVEPKERARLAGGGDLGLAGHAGIRLQPAQRSLPDVAIEGPGGVRDQSVKIRTTASDPTRVVVNLRPAAADSPGIVRVFDVAERSASGRLLGGTTFVTVGLA
ncbi:MAG: hypothetical protein ABL971_05360 [Vicinamibacterales bacterium]